MRNNWQIWNPVKVGRAKGPSPSHRTDATTTLFGKMAHEPGGPPTSSREPGGPATRSSPGNGNYAKAAADECRICYERYDQRGRRARLLACLHRVCAKCLRRMLDVGQSSLSPCVVTCPFCRGKTSVPPEEAWGTEEERGARRDRVGSGSAAASPGLGDGLLITVAELPSEWPSPNDGEAVALYRRAGRDSPGKGGVRTRGDRRVPRCLLGALCLVYLGSLPVGIYLLMLERTWPGVLLVGLVPSTLLLLLLYACCDCLSQQLLEALAVRRQGFRRRLAAATTASGVH
ncbi:E3 ubiquitin-protein ligase RNF182-like isoform X3 [Stigmatopora nigra]